MINWHRLFGLALTDFFTESAWVVELEKDLSLKRQLLDVVILRKEKGTKEASLPVSSLLVTTEGIARK